ncbi:DNA adenine methylase [Martelella alba]|uniref:DNA adenine methylase n=1 Tax=Martelella alba TaxID=2590451 RepID=A0ABY2SHQ1_9HYPH|nr:DNA adenine methylase [Martelella alba]TKI02221.1 DNA adenine methylase [Martelella alba]
MTDLTQVNGVRRVHAPAIRYHGGKFRIAPWIISHFPAHACYVEPFGGGAGVLLQKPRSYAEVYNDLDSDIVNLFRVLRDPELNSQLRDACLLTPYAREEFYAAYDPGDTPLERARRTVVRATMGFGSGAANKRTGFRGDSKRKYATAADCWARYPTNLSALCQRLQGVIIENKDALTVMRAHDAATTLHYIDPPYLPETRVWRGGAYRHEMDVFGHEQLLAVARTLVGHVVISGYDSELYNDYLSGWETYKKESRISAGRGTALRIECLWIRNASSEVAA